MPPWLQDCRWAARVRPRLTLTCAPTTPAVLWTRPSTAISARAAALPRRTARAPRPAVSTTANLAVLVYLHELVYHSQPPLTSLPQPTSIDWFTTANLYWLVYQSQLSCTGLPQPTSSHSHNWLRHLGSLQTTQILSGWRKDVVTTAWSSLFALASTFLFVLFVFALVWHNYLFLARRKVFKPKMLTLILFVPVI